MLHSLSRIFMHKTWKWIGSHHGLRTPNEGINQRSLKIWAYVADKICFSHTLKFGSGSWFSALQWKRFPHRASIVHDRDDEWDNEWLGIHPFFLHPACKGVYILDYLLLDWLQSLELAYYKASFSWLGTPTTRKFKKSRFYIQFNMFRALKEF